MVICTYDALIRWTYFAEHGHKKSIFGAFWCSNWVLIVYWLSFLKCVVVPVMRLPIAPSLS